MKGQDITEAELKAAIRKFLQSGGIIQKLPDQRPASDRMVGRKWNNSEMAGEGGY